MSDLRMLGTRDGLAHALIWVKQQIAHIDGPYAPKIEARHVRKRATRDAVLRPLRELEKRLTRMHADTMKAYENSPNRERTSPAP